MNRRRNRDAGAGWLAQLAAVLALVLFAAAPAAEAASCGYEAVRTTAAVSLNAAGALETITQTDGEAPEQAPKGGVKPSHACTHGHCHHAAAAPADDAGAEAARPVRVVPVTWSGLRAPPGAHPSLLKPPPRV